jgi:hypothetical protein
MCDRTGWTWKLRLCIPLAALLAPLLVNADRAAAQAVSYTSRFETLRRTINAHHVRSVEELLPLLSPAMRSRFVLVFDSRSVQEASRPNPRVLLFGNDARFILSFNGDARLQGFDTLETMEFDDASAAFAFREIRFPGAAAGEDAEVEFSQANPTLCVACHGAPAHPIWDVYPLWPGVYGERYQRALSEQEADGLSAFAQTQGTHPRYRYLEGFNAEQLGEQMAPTQRRRYSGTIGEPPNAVLSALLGRLTVSVIEQDVKASPRFNDYRYALLWSLHPVCGGVLEVVPAAVVASYTQDFAPFAQTLKAEARLQALYKLRRATRGVEGALFASEDATLDGFRYLSEQGLGLSTRHWTLALEQDNYDLTMQVSVASQLERHLLAWLANDDPKLAELRQAAEVSNDVKYCARLRRLSLEALNRPPSATTSRTPASS